VVTLTGRTFADQRDLFRSAGIIAGAHGAGLANLAFMAPASRVFEIMPPLAGTRAFGIMARALGLHYAMFVAEDAELPVRPGARYDPMLSSRAIRADPCRLATDLDRFLRTGSGPG
jgi:capsular polysaccharide biosynthesis protein